MNWTDAIVLGLGRWATRECEDSCYRQGVGHPSNCSKCGEIRNALALYEALQVEFPTVEFRNEVNEVNEVNESDAKT